MRCCLCGKDFAVTGHTGGSPEGLGLAELILLESFAAFKCGMYGSLMYVLHAVNLAEFHPWDAHNIAVLNSAHYPDGVIVIRLGWACAFSFTAANCRLVHIGCALNQLRLHLSVGVVVDQSNRIFALQIGRRHPPFAKLVQ